eukprot:Skav235884  [mRNA]  locus=scaffold5594:13070:15073:+ [translate_table: standard]
MEKPQQKSHERQSQAVASHSGKCLHRKERKGGKSKTGPLGPPSGRMGRLPWRAAKTALCAEAKELLGSFKASQFFWPDGKRGDAKLVFDGPGFLDLYSGKAGVAKSLALTFGCWVLSVDWDHGADEDLLQPELQRKLLRLVELRAFLGVGAAPDCSSFSRAVCPAVRSIRFPYGLADISDNMKKKVAKGNLHAAFCAKLLRCCKSLAVPYWLENPDGSFLWALPEFQEAGLGWPEHSYRVDQCRFKTPWRKRTRFATDTALAGRRELCLGYHEHLRLRGRSAAHKLPWTRVAQAYPAALSRLIARHLGLAAGLKPLGKQAKLDLAACARSDSLRIGEAQHPGPPVQRAHRDVALLLGVPLVEPATARLQDRVWTGFQRWLGEELSEEAAGQVFLCPTLAVEVLRRYGVELFRTGHPLYELRHLLALVQRLYPAVKAVLAPAWSLVSQWEEINPVQHRQPLTELLMKAMVALAWLWGWKRFAGCIVLAFEGIARVGEVLRARRADLVLPADLDDPELTAAFLRIRRPKTMRRGKGRVQHLKVSGCAHVEFLYKVFGELEDFLPLFPLSASSFRSRWEKLLFALKVPKHLQPSPGGLRGGGAIAAYRRGEALQSIMWRMRLLSISTLESYVQELAAESYLSKLPDVARRRIRSAALFYPLALGHSVGSK